MATVKAEFRNQGVLQLTGKPVTRNYNSKAFQYGDSDSFAYVPTNGFACPYCGSLFGGGYFVPTKYCETSGSDTNDLLKIGFGKATNVYNNKVGYTACLRMDVEAVKPGRTNVTASYYCNFEMYILNSSVYGDNGQGTFACSYCYNRGYIRYITASNDATWHKYTEKFPVIVNADYVLNYDANGGTVTPTSERKTVASTSATFSLPTPTRDGYTFKGWSDGTNTYTGSYTLNWSE